MLLLDRRGLDCMSVKDSFQVPAAEELSTSMIATTTEDSTCL
jgi:hypothetical protein